MLFLVVERFERNDMLPVYARLRNSGGALFLSSSEKSPKKASASAPGLAGVILYLSRSVFYKPDTSGDGIFEIELVPHRPRDRAISVHRHVAE